MRRVMKKLVIEFPCHTSFIHAALNKLTLSRESLQVLRSIRVNAESSVVIPYSVVNANDSDSNAISANDSDSNAINANDSDFNAINANDINSNAISANGNDSNDITANDRSNATYTNGSDSSSTFYASDNEGEQETCPISTDCSQRMKVLNLLGKREWDE